MDQHTATPETEERSSFGRRTVLKGVAWSVPVVAVVGATPAIAATPRTVPIVESGTLSGARGSKNTKKTVTFTWSFKSNVTITGVSVTTNQPTRFAITAVTAPTSVNGSASATFSGENGSSDTTVVPTFTITVSFTQAGSPKTATFTVVSASVAENGSTEFTVTPSTTNPTVTI